MSFPPATSTSKTKQEPTDDSDSLADSKKGGLKGSPPTPFDGTDRTQVDAFIKDCALYFRLNPSKFEDDDDKVMTAYSYLKGGTAGIWKDQQLGKHLDEATYDYVNLPTWKEWVKEFKAAFTDENTKQNAKDKLYALRQGNKPLDEYNIEWNLVAGKAGYDITAKDEALLENYKRSINTSLLGKMLMLEVVPTTLSSFQSKAAILDRHWRQAQKITNPNKNFSNSSNRSKSRFIPRRNDTSRSIEVNATLTNAQRDEYIRNGKCFHCAQTGHISRDCPTRRNTNRFSQGSSSNSSYTPNNSQNQRRNPKDTAKHIRSLLQDYTEEERDQIANEMAEQGF